MGTVNTRNGGLEIWKKITYTPSLQKGIYKKINTHPSLGKDLIFAFQQYIQQYLFI